MCCFIAGVNVHSANLIEAEYFIHSLHVYTLPLGFKIMVLHMQLIMWWYAYIRERP